MREETLTEALYSLGYTHKPAAFGRRRIIDWFDDDVGTMNATEAWAFVKEERMKWLGMLPTGAASADVSLRREPDVSQTTSQGAPTLDDRFKPGGPAISSKPESAAQNRHTNQGEDR